MLRKSLRAVGSLLEHMRTLERSWDGVREGPGEKRRSDDAPEKKVGGIGATPYRGKPLGGTGSALDHGGRAGLPLNGVAPMPPTFFSGASSDLRFSPGPSPNDADDAGPLGQYHQHHWGPVSPFARLLGCLCPLC